MPDAMAVRIVELAPGQVEIRSAEIETVYREAFAQPPHRADAQAARVFVEGQLLRHTGYEGFRFVAAELDGALAGFAYGYTGRRGTWWTDRAAEVLPPDLAREWLGGHFEFVELAVRPPVQRRGIGGRLHDRLLADVPNDRALLSTLQEETAAVRLYRRNGWTVLVSAVRFSPEDEPRMILGLDLRAWRSR